MSYDLNFWKYEKGSNQNHQEVYLALSDEEPVIGLEILPVNEILKEFEQTFSDWEKSEGYPDWENKNGKGAFQLSTSDKHVRADCYGMHGEDMNRIIDIMIKFDCPLYDPQVPKRYDGAE